MAYPEYVDMVYKTFNPFDYETGKGIVAAPPKEELLRPAQFIARSAKLPTWARSGRPRSGSGSSGRCSRSSPGQQEGQGLGFGVSSRRS